MLDLERIDLRSLADALDDRSGYTSWWLDPETSEVDAWPTDYDLTDSHVADGELVSERAAQDYLEAHPLPHQPELSGPVDVESVSRAVVRDLRELYGLRLKRVLLFGSWARGEADEDSDVDLLVVLRGDHVDPVAERRRIANPLWEQSLRVGRVVSVVVASEKDVEDARTPFLARVAAEGREMA